MNKNKIATQNLMDYMVDNPLIDSDGYCLNDRFVENCLYSSNSLQAAYLGSIEYMDGMVDSVPEVKENPLLVPMSSWLDIFEQWGEANKKISPIDTVMPSATWEAIAWIETKWSFPKDLPQPVTIKDVFEKEANYLSELIRINEKEELATGIMRKVMSSISENKADAPLIQWCYYINMTPKSLRMFIDAVLPAPENYINIKEIYKTLEEI